MFKQGKSSFDNTGKQLRKSRSTIATHYHLVIAIKRCYLFSAEEIKKTFQGMTLKTQESYSKDFQNKAKGWCWNQSCETSSRSSLRKAIDWRQRVCFMPPGLKLFVLRWKK